MSSYRLLCRAEPEVVVFTEKRVCVLCGTTRHTYYVSRRAILDTKTMLVGMVSYTV